MSRRVAALLLLSLFAVACGARSRGAARGPDRRALVRLERQAQRDMGCRTPLHVQALDLRAYQLDGCGQMREYSWVCTGRRCIFEPIIPAAARASADLQCAPDQLAGQADAPTHRAFFGCMRGAAYSLMCMDHGCTWSRTGETVTIATPAAPVFASIGGSAPALDPTLSGVAIPPPPGAPSAFAAPLPTEVPAPPPAQAIVPPPPGTASTAPSATPGDTIVIPPPPS